MADEFKDDNNEEFDSSSDSSADKDQGSSDGAGSDNNGDEQVTLTKKELDQIKQELGSVKSALKIEREKFKKKGFLVDEEEETTTRPPKKKDEDWFDEQYKTRRAKEVREELSNYEENAKATVVKRFPKLQADNEYGIRQDVVEAYVDLLGSRTKRGNPPRNQEQVSELLERAIRMVEPNIFMTKEEKEEEYSGVEATRGMESEDKNKPRLNKEEKKLVNFVDRYVKNNNI